MEIILHRQDQSSFGTFGAMTLNGVEICKTCELPWNDNHPQTSCIPVGTYQVAPHNTVAHPNTWELLNVPGRSAILIHTGNTVEDSKGCIIVGTAFGQIDGKKAVVGSRAAMAKLREILPDKFTLTIV